MKSNETKVITLGTAAILLAGAVGAGIDHVLFPQKVEVPIYKDVLVNNTIVKEVPVEVIKEVTVSKEVLVDNGKLDLVLQEVMDSNGDMIIYTEDLKDSEVSLIADRVVFKVDMINKSENLVDSDLVSYMDDEHMFNKGDLDGYRVGDVSSISIDKDVTTISGIDFEDKDATVLVNATIRLNDDDNNKLKLKAIVEVEVVEGKLEIVDVTLE